MARLSARRSGSLIVVIAAISALVVPSPGAATAPVVLSAEDPTPPFAATFTRYAGPDRFATAAVVSRRTFPLGADRVFVATGGTFPDALAAGAVAGAGRSPILLTAATSLPEATALELARLGPSEVIVMGGSAAVSDAVMAAIADASGVTPVRVGGSDRFHTAALLSQRQFPAGSHTVLIATGGNFPDALAAGPLAARQGSPILLVATTSLPATTAEELTRLDPAEAIVLGGTAAVADEVLAEIERAAGATATRVAGPDRFSTAVEISKRLAVDGEAAFLATGANFPDALGGGPAAAVRSGPLLLTPFDCVPEAVVEELERRDPDRVPVLGGAAVISDRAAAGVPCGLEGELPALTFSVDAGVTPVEGSAPPRDGTEGPRPLASVRDEHGAQMDFAVNELIVIADGAELDGILGRTGGRIVETTSQDPPIHRVLVAPPAMDGVELASLLRQGDLRSRGAHAATSPEALGLLTLAAREAVAGHLVMVNYRLFGDDYLGRQLADGPDGPDGPSGYTYDPNPFTWPWLRNVTDPESSLPDWGVAEAWRALELAGRFIPTTGDRFGIEVIDGGFPSVLGSYDLQGQVATLNYAEGPNTGSCSGGTDCPWHGTLVSQTAAGAADNGMGTAGVGHPVAEIIPFQWNGDVLDTLRNWVQSVPEGISIVNQSFSSTVPASLYVLMLPVEALVIIGHLGGISYVAAAGNSGDDVDATDCFFICWEESLTSPCELEATICVGGASNAFYGRDPGSNYGTDQPPGATVDLYAPWQVYVGKDPDNDTANARRTQGTSFSAPWVAGLLALIRAGDDSVVAIGSEDHLLDTVVKSGRTWFADAEEAVIRALGGQRPPTELRIDRPFEGETVRRGQNLPLEITLIGGPAATVTWSIDGTEVGTGTTTAFNVTRTSLSLGDHEVRADYVAGIYRWTFRRTITVENTPPTGTITDPDGGESFCQSCNVNLRATSFDPDETDSDLSGGQLVWTVDGQAGTLATGGSAVVTGAEIGPPGNYTLRLTGTDSEGASFSDTVSISTVNDPADVPPNVKITSPADGGSEQIEATDGTGSYAQITLEGTYDDPDGDDATLTIQWSVVQTGGPTQPPPAFIGSSTANPTEVKLYNDSGSNVTYDITLTVTEPDGPSTSDTVTFTVLPFI